MLKWFITPTGEFMEVSKALESGALAEYYPMAYLAICAQERNWTGKPSTTQLLNGTRLEYLKIITDYAIDPDQCAFRVGGTNMHEELHKRAPAEAIAEMALPDDEISGIPDLIEKQPNGEYWLIDYKRWGSYKMKMFFAGDTFEVDMQLNRYKMVAEEYYGIKISRMRIFVEIRDGGLEVAQRRKIDRNTYFCDIKERDLAEVEIYFQQKRQALLDALLAYEHYLSDTEDPPEADPLRGSCPAMCSDAENWKGMRCRRYCPVSDTCKALGNHYLNG